MIDGIEGSFGGDFVEIELGNTGDVLPPKNGRIALIDADTVLFGSCLSSQIEADILSEEFYTEQEWLEITNDIGYDEDECVVRSLDINLAYQKTIDKLQGILDRTGCLSWELHFTGGRKSFRYTMVDDEYKANRLNDKTKKPPAGLRDLKDLFCTEFPDKAFMNLLYEADDTVVARKRAQPEKYTLCAVDKDVLYTLPTLPEELGGKHFNYYSRPRSTNKWGKVQEEIKMKYIEVSELQAIKHHYLQVLTGDTTDNVIGLHMVGPKKADTALELCTTHEECWDKVLEMYELKERSPFDAIKNMRLVGMHQVTYYPESDSYELDLWRPISIEEQILDSEQSIKGQEDE